MIKKACYICFYCIILISCVRNGDNKEQSSERPIFQQVIEERKLKVVTLNNSTSYFLYRGTPMGFHYELIKKYTEKLGVTLDLEVATDSKMALEMLQKGQCHILATNVGITGRRKRKMLFTAPFFQTKPVLVQNKQSKKQYVEDWLDVDTLQVAIAKGLENEHLVKNLEETLGLCMNVLYYSEIDQEDLLSWVAEDSIPATFSDEITAKVAKTYFPNLDISISAGLPHNIAWAVNLEATDLLQNVNEWLRFFKKTPEYRRLYTKYFRNTKSILRNKEGQKLSKKRLSPYDAIIKEEAKKMGWDWRLFSALIYTESRFDPKQVSWAGAFGIMQMMPVTARNFGASRNSSVKKQIEAGRKYIQYLEEKFAKRMVDRTDIKSFVLGAYNSGSMHIVDAQNLAEKYGKNKDKWNEVAPYVVLLNNPKYYKDKVVKYGYFRGRETVNHVKRIQNIYENYKALIPKE